MENTIESARAFMAERLKDRGVIAQSTIYHEYIEWLVSYAATIRPASEVVVRVPSEREGFDLTSYEK